MTQYLVVDTETTGVNPLKDHLWEVGIVDPDRLGQPGSKFHAMIDFPLDCLEPNTFPAWNFERRREEWEKGRYLTKATCFVALEQWMEQQGYDSPVFVSHGTDFDWAFMRQLGDLDLLFHHRKLDIRSLFWAVHGPQAMSMRQACILVGIDLDAQPAHYHTALGDAEMSALCFNYIRRKVQQR